MRRTTRLGAYVASAALALSTLALGVPSAQAGVAQPAPGQAGGTWLEGELTNGLIHNNNYGGFDDYGLSIDAALALDAVGGHDDSVDDIADAVGAHVGSYTTGADFGAPNDVYSGALAKTAVLAVIAGDDPRTFGGTDVLAQLEGTVTGSGRLKDRGSANYANVIGQVLAAKALMATGSQKASAVTRFLLSQQCDAGWFRLLLSDASSAEQGCSQAEDSPDTDVTALAVRLLSDQKCDPAVVSALEKARTWLSATQKNDGSFGGGTATESSNTNSTGLASWALAGTPDGDEAAEWVRGRQVGSADDSTALSEEDGAIAYDDAALAAGRTDGIDDDNSDQWRRATAQALLAFAAPTVVEPSTATLHLSGPAGYLKAGSTQSLITDGARPGDGLCLTGPEASARTLADENGWKASVTLPEGTATRSYTVRDADGHSDTATLQVLGRKTLAVHKSKSRVRRSGRISVVVRGFEPGEQAKVYYKGRIKKRGTANSAGKIRTSFRVGRATGRKRIVAVGQFTDIRRGTTAVRVRR